MILADSKNRQGGFTIVELMIAMAVLSVLLVVVSVAMMSIGSLYNKGINQAKVQNAVRSISDELGSHLQLMGGSSGIGPFSAPNVVVESQSYPVNVYCIGEVRYTYVVGVQQGTDSTATTPQIAHVLWRDKQPGTCTDNIPTLKNANPGTNGVELVPNGARLTQFNISQVLSGVYTVDVGIAYGENDLLTGTGSGTRCIGNVNTKFCATAYLSTKVARRL